MKKVLATVAFLLCGGLAQAQIPTSGNVFIGYSLSGGDVAIPSAPERSPAAHAADLNGWEGSLEGKLLPWVGIVADLSGQYGSHDLQVCSFVVPPCSAFGFRAHRYTVLFGPRVSVPIGRFTPFAHALVGVGRVTDTGDSISATDTSWAYAIGGGLDYKLIPGIAWRVQGDELHTRFFGETQHHFRFSTGLVLRF